MGDRLYRSRRDRVIGGLAAGMGRGLGIDVTWVRIGWVVLAFATQGIAILVYVALLFVVPEAPEGSEIATLSATGDEAPAPSASGTPPPTPPAAPFTIPGSETSRSAALIVGVVLVIAGAWLLLRRLVPFDFDLTWPVLAVAVGLILVVASLRTGRSG